MPAIPAQCTNPECRAIYPSGIWVENSSDITIRGGRSQCPACGSMGLIAEGVFSATTDTIEVISAPDFTLDMLKSVQDSLKRAKSGEISPDEALDQVKIVAPKLAAALSHVKNNEALYAMLISLIALAISIWDMRSNDDFQDRLLSVLENSSGYSENHTGHNHTETNADNKGASDRPVAQKLKDRRAIVNAERRAKLKAHRSAFGGSAIIHNIRIDR